jgi:hypothetical protein
MQECEELILKILGNHKRPITIKSLFNQVKKNGDLLLEYQFRYCLTHLLANGKVNLTLNRKLCLK